MDLGTDFKEDEPTLIATSIDEQKNFHHDWAKANNKDSMFIQRSIDETFVETTPWSDNAELGNGTRKVKAGQLH